MITFFKWFIILTLLITLTASSKEKSDESTVWVCGRWAWTGDVFNRKVYCLEWAKRDCSNRLHKDICKSGG
jgi:hypothetical protein